MNAFSSNPVVLMHGLIGDLKPMKVHASLVSMRVAAPDALGNDGNVGMLIE